MPRPGPEIELVPSVLDRLIDEEPGASREPEGRRRSNLAQLKISVRRDLEWLLNTKRLLVDVPDSAPALAESLLNYGLPDFTHASLGTLQDRRELRRVIEEAVTRFEPRLRDVVVTLMDAGPHDRSLRFRIDAVLDVEPTPEAVTFDSTLQMPTHAIVVQDT